MHNNINYPYAIICVPDIIKKLNVKIFNLMSRTNETCKCSINLALILAIINNVGIKKNADVNAKN